MGRKYRTGSVCLNEMTIRVQRSPLVHSALSMLRCSVHSAAKSLPMAAARLWINVTRKCRQTAAKQTGPCLEGSRCFQLPLVQIVPLMEASAGAPEGPLTTENRPLRIHSLLLFFLLSPHPSIVFHPQSDIDLILFNQKC